MSCSGSSSSGSRNGGHKRWTILTLMPISPSHAQQLLIAGLMACMVGWQVFRYHSNMQQAPSLIGLSDFPPTCSSSDLEMVRQQLPPVHCRGLHEPCSTNLATRCSDPVWLWEDYRERNMRQTPNAKRVGIFVGCNKGDHAANALRMLSNDPR